MPAPYLREHAVHFIEGMARDQWSERSGALFCIAAPDDRVLGSCGLVSVDADHRVAEIGYWVAAEARGIGVAQRAVSALIGWALGVGGMHRLEIYVEPSNTASCAVAQGVGAVREGVARGKALVQGAWADMAVYAITN